MWLTGFDVPFLDTIYIDKPIQRHNSTYRRFLELIENSEGKEKGFGGRLYRNQNQMNPVMAQYNQGNETNIEEIEHSVVVVKISWICCTVFSIRLIAIYIIMVIL